MVSVRDNIMPMNRTHARRSTMVLRLAAVPLLVAALPAAVALAGSRQADTVMLNGAILVFQGIERNGGAKQPKFAQAVAIADGRIAATHIFGEAIMPPGTALTRDDLDRLDTTRPVMVENADGHKFWMNGRAIENARIDEKTPVPPGGQIGRDASGRPNGFFADLDVG